MVVSQREQPQEYHYGGRGVVSRFKKREDEQLKISVSNLKILFINENPFLF